MSIFNVPSFPLGQCNLLCYEFFTPLITLTNLIIKMFVILKGSTNNRRTIDSIIALFTDFFESVLALWNVTHDDNVEGVQ